MKLFVGHGGAAEKIKKGEVQPERAVGLHLNQVIVNGLCEFRLAIGRQPHEFVFAGIDAEAAIRGECGIEQPERVREAEFLQEFDLVALALSNGRRGPFADAVNGENGCLCKRRGIKALAAWD